MKRKEKKSSPPSLILTVKGVWSKELYKSGKIEQVSISSELTQRNIKSITELDSLGLLVYQVKT